MILMEVKEFILQEEVEHIIKDTDNLQQILITNGGTIHQLL